MDPWYSIVIVMSLFVYMPLDIFCCSVGMFCCSVSDCVHAFAISCESDLNDSIVVASGMFQEKQHNLEKKVLHVETLLNEQRIESKSLLADAETKANKFKTMFYDIKIKYEKCTESLEHYKLAKTKLEKAVSDMRQNHYV